MIFEYWLAGYLGHAWLSLRKRLRPGLGELPGLCQRVARGERLPASELWRVQDFAVRVWWRFGMAVWLLAFPIIGIGAAVRPGQAGRNVLADMLVGLGCVTAAAIAQAGMIRYRSDRIRLRLRKGGQPPRLPLPTGAPGLPRRSDFWVMLMIALFACAILFAWSQSAQR